MKFRGLLLNGVATWLLCANSAEAAPVAAAISAVAGLLSAGGIAGAVAQLVFGMALSYGVSAIQKALAKKQQRKAEPRGVALDVRLGDDQPAQFIVGTYATAGIRKYTGTWGQASKTPNAFLTDVIELSCIPHPGLAGVWIDDTKGTILWNEPQPDGLGYPVAEFRENGTDYAWVRFVDGTQTVADPWLIAKFGSHPERPFKASMIGRGCAFAVVTFRYNTEKFGGLPAMLFEMQPMPLYDLRKDSTNGGSGPQRWNDRSTWQPSDNNAVVIYNLVRGIYYGNEWIYGGQNLSAFRLPASNWIAAANECDRLVDNAAGGQEKQFRCGYEVRLDMEPLSVVDDIRQGCAGRIAEVGGVFKMLAGVPGAAVYSFTDDDILVTKDQSFEPFPSLSETHNGIEATYPEPAEKWASKDAPARYSSALEADDGNRRLATGIEFPAVPFGRQVQALMKVMIEEERRFRTHLFHLPPDAFAFEPNDVVSWSSNRNGYANKKFLVDRILGKFTFNQLVRLKEIDPSDYSWSGTDELPTDVGWLGPIVAPSQPMYGWTVEPYAIKDASGVDRRPSIKVSCAADQDDVKNVLVEVRLKSSQEVVFQSDATAYAAPYSWVLPGTFLPNTQYEVRGRFVPYSNRQTDWSSWITVTTPNLLISSADIFDNAIIAQKIADAAVSADKLMNAAVTSLKLADQAVTTAKLQVAAVTEQILANGAVISSKLADAAVTAQKLADQAVTATKFASGIRPVEVVSTLPTTGNTEGRIVYLTTDNKLYRYDGGAWIASVAAGDIAGTIADAQIAAIAASKVTGQMTDAQIAAVAAAKVTGQMTDAQIAAVAAAKVTGTLVSSQIADLAITNSKLAALAVDAAKLANNAVTTTKIADDAISTPKLQANAVVADKIAANAVTARSLLLADQENLVANGNIEDTSPIGNYWGAVLGGGVLAYLSKANYPDLVSTGTHSFILQKNAGNYAASVNVDMTSVAIFPVTAGEVLYGETAIKTNGSPTTAGAYFRVLWLDADKVAIPGGDGVGYGDIAANVPMTANWVTHSRKITVPANAAFGRVRLYNHSTQTTTQNAIFDRLILRRANAANLVVDGSILTNHMAAGSVTTSKIAADAVTANELAANAVTAVKIVAGAVTTAKIAADAVTANELAANAVTAVKISAGAVETAKIAVGAIIAVTIAAGAVTTAKLDALAVTSDKLAANSVIAGKIAVGAVAADQVAANAITSVKIAAGAISTDKLAVGSGKNLLQNASFTMGLDCWAAGAAGSIPGLLVAIRTPSEPYAGPASPTFMVRYPGTGPTGYYCDLRQKRPDAAALATAGASYGYPCQPGEYFEATAYTSAHRCNIELRIEWRDAAGNGLGYTGADVNSNQSSSSTNPDLWPRLRTTGAAPAGAVTAGIHIRKTDTAAGQSDSYMFVHKPMLCRIPSGATEATPWSDGGVVLITGGGIVAEAITADKIAANAITAGKIAAGVVTATEIASGAVTAVKIAAGAVATDKLAANAVTSDKIAANAITAKQLILTDFDNLIANGNFDEGNVSNTWSAVNGGGTFYVLSDPQFVQTGAYSAILQKNAGNSGGSIFVDMLPDFDIAVKAGEVLYGETSIRTNEASQAAGAYFRIRWLDASKAEIGISDVVNNAPISGTFTLRSGKVTVPANAKFARIRLYHHNTSSISNLMFDRLILRRANAAELLVDGSIFAQHLAASSVTADKLSVTSLSAVSGSFGDAYFSGIARSVNGKLLLDFNNGGVEIFT